MDTFARALIVADAILKDGQLDSWRKERYASFDDGNGAAFEQGKLTLEQLRDLPPLRENRHASAASRRSTSNFCRSISKLHLNLSREQGQRGIRALS